MKDRTKLLVVQPNLNPPGGGNAVVVWLLEALKHEYEITVLCWEAADFAAINRYYGTALQAGDFAQRTVGRWLRPLVDLIPDPWKFQRFCVLMRWCKMVRRRYDVLLTVSNECDFGASGIQYVHYPYLEHNWRQEPQLQQGKKPAGYWRRWLKSRLRPWRLISGFSFGRMQQNLTLVNAEWTADYYRKLYQAECQVVYPPVPGDFPEVPWALREEGFVCVGRISGEKRLEELIDILAAVRRRGFDIHLHILGSKVEYDLDCYRRVSAKVEQHADWVVLQEDLSRQQLIEEISRHRYGIHGMIDEHFGIGVAEMVRGGCITFVPNSGGQVEIVGRDARLLYDGCEEAVDRVAAVLEQPEQQRQIEQHLAKQKAYFTTERFVDQVRQIVAAQRPGGGSAPLTPVVELNRATSS